jgi:hypothetical protein
VFRVDRAVLQVVERAVVDVADEIGAKLRIRRQSLAGTLDEPIAEEHAVFLIGEFGGKLLRRRLE